MKLASNTLIDCTYCCLHYSLHNENMFGKTITSCFFSLWTSVIYLLSAQKTDDYENTVP